MRFRTVTSPHVLETTSVGRVMRRVLYAMIPGIAALCWFFGWGVLINLAIATGVALVAETAMLAARGKPLALHLADYSAVVTAWLLAVALPPLAPWWLTTIGVLSAIVVAKHLYGGLGYNPFNPAMIGYVVLLISFPREMSTWLIPHGLDQHHAMSLPETLHAIFWSALPARFAPDALTGATALDVLRTKLGLGLTVTEIRNSPVFGIVAGHGWEWAALGFLAGGLWLIYTRTADWRIPAGMLGGLAVISTVFYLIDPQRYAPPCAAVRTAVVSSVERRGDFRRVFHRHRSGYRQHHAARAIALWSGRWRSGLRHSRFRRLSRWRGVFGTADEHRRADHRSVHPAASVRSTAGMKAIARNMGIAALILAGFAVVGTGLVAVTYTSTQDIITEAQRAALEASLNQLVPADRYDNRVIEDRIEVVAPEWLGTDQPVTVYRSR